MGQASSQTPFKLYVNAETGSHFNTRWESDEDANCVNQSSLNGELS